MISLSSPSNSCDWRRKMDSVEAMELPPPPIPQWGIKVVRDAQHTEIFVTNGIHLGEGLWYANERKQTLWQRLRAKLTGKGSTAKIVRFTDEDLDKVGRYLAEKYGLEWKPVNE